MDLNKIKLLKKEELLQKLKQSGFAEVANILEDKNINGESLIDLKEFETFKWKLNPSQKNAFWDCVKRIKDKPSILMVRERTKVIQKPVATKGRLENAEPNQEFKNKLQGLLGPSATSIGGSATLPKVTKQGSRPALPSTQKENKPINKSLPPPPPPSPPPRNEGAKNTNVPIKKNPLPLPEINDDESYLQMNPPAKNTKPYNVDDYYLAPTNPILPQDSKAKSPNLPKRMVQKEGRSTKLQEESAEEENTYELSPPPDNVRESRSPNISNRRFPLKTTADQINEYQQLPDQASKPSSTTKVTLKDMQQPILVVNGSQQESKFSFLTSKLNFFKSMNKPKTLYENCEIQGEKSGHIEVSVRDRPLPDIPVSPMPVRAIKTQSSRPAFPRPNPTPRSNTPDSHSQSNYVQLVNSFRPSAAHEKENSDNENQIYENASKTQDTDEEQLIYENTSKTEHSDDEQQIYENAADLPESTNKTAKKYVDGFSSNQLPVRDTRRKMENKSPLESKLDVDYVQPPMVRNLAVLLSEKLMERNKNLQLQQQQHQQEQQQQIIVDSGTDSDFDDDDELPIYDNISNNNENGSSPIPKEEVIEEIDTPPRTEDRKIPVYKRALPEIPKRGLPPNKASANKASPSSLGTESFTTRFSQNKNRNGTKAESLPGPGPSRPVAHNYVHHSMPYVKEKNTLQQSGAGIKTSKNEESGSGNIFNLSEEPFFRNTDRKGAKQILSRFGNGAFLFRPSKTYFLVLTVKHNKKIYNIGIERSANNKLRLNTEGNMEPPEFFTLHEFVAYFSDEPVTFEYGDELLEIYLKTDLQSHET